jgi:hypothetical protein
MKIGRGWEKKGLVSLKLTHYLEGRKQLSFKIAMLSTSRARQRTTKVTNQILAKPSSNRPNKVSSKAKNPPSRPEGLGTSSQARRP